MVIGLVMTREAAKNHEQRLCGLNRVPGSLSPLAVLRLPRFAFVAVNSASRRLFRGTPAGAVFVFKS
jgi:hypothetical protein